MPFLDQIQKCFDATEFATMAEPDLGAMQLMVQRFDARMPPCHIPHGFCQLGKCRLNAEEVSGSHQHIGVCPVQMFQVMVIKHRTRHDQDVSHVPFRVIQRRVLFAAMHRSQ